MASEESTMGGPVGLFLFGRAGVVFFELTLTTPVSMYVHWMGSGEEKVKKRWI